MKKYEIIVNDIIDKINLGIFKKGDRLYTEKEIKEKYLVSSTTAVRALKELEDIGYITRVQGSGSFLKKTMVNKKVFFSEKNNFSKYFGHKYNEKARVIGVEIFHSQELCKKLGVDFQEILKITRVKSIGDVNWAHQTNYILMKHIAGIDITDIEKFSELSHMIRQNYNIDIHKEKSRRKIRVITDVPENVRVYIAKENEPCFEFDHYTYLSNGELFDFAKIYINYKYYEIDIND